MNSPYEAGSLLSHEVTLDNGNYTTSDLDGYNAAPVLLVGEDADSELVERQRLLAERFANAAHGEFDGIYRDKTVNFIIHSIHNRMHSREGLNASAYMSRLYRQPVYEFAPEFSREIIDEACAAVKNATATVMQNEIARKVWGMSSVEYTNLTLVNDFRGELEEPMWDEVSELTGHDVRPTHLDDYQIEKARILGFDRLLEGAQHIGALRIGLKRTVGELEDGTLVKVRTSAVVNTNHNSHVDRAFINDILETANQKVTITGRDGEFFAEETINSDAALDRINKLPGFKPFVQRLIEEQFRPDEVLARNETVYGTNPQTAHQLKIYKAETTPLPIIKQD